MEQQLLHTPNSPLNGFDKFCIIVGVPIGAIFLLLGAFGLFMGSNAHFTLPPVLGILPFFPGWALTVVAIKAWKSLNNS